MRFQDDGCLAARLLNCPVLLCLADGAKPISSTNNSSGSNFSGAGLLGCSLPAIYSHHYSCDLGGIMAPGSAALTRRIPPSGRNFTGVGGLRLRPMTLTPTIRCWLWRSKAFSRIWERARRFLIPGTFSARRDRLIRRIRQINPPPPRWHCRQDAHIMSCSSSGALVEISLSTSRWATATPHTVTGRTARSCPQRAAGCTPCIEWRRGSQAFITTVQQWRITMRRESTALNLMVIGLNPSRFRHWCPPIQP